MTNNPSQSEKSVNEERSEAAKREEAILQYWDENNIFEKTLLKDSPKGEFVFFDGPPTANGKPAIHHMEGRSFKDIIPRYKTMQGFHVRRKAGWDTHGLPVELEVEKQLGLTSKKEIEEYGIALFNAKCRESVWKYVHEWEELTRRIGYWEDMNNPYVTYYSGYIEALWGIIKKADEKNILYKDFKVLPWCTRCETALSSHELNQPGAYRDVKDLSVTVQFKVLPGQRIKEFISDEKTYVLAWTTTPWTLPGNVALAVGKEIAYALVEVALTEEKFIVAHDLVSKLFEGKEYSILSILEGESLLGVSYEPLYPFLEALLPDDQKKKLGNAYRILGAGFVTTTDGTGIVHTAVMYGADDFELGTTENLPKLHLVNEQGKFVSGTGFLEGRYVKETDEKGKPMLAVDIIDDLTSRGLLFKKENYLHSYPHCWRCGTPLLYYARTSWYFNMKSLRDKMVLANKTINWEPDHIKEGRFGEWLDGVKDWAISRDRYWGTPIPVWETEDEATRVVVGSLQDIKKYAKKSGNKYFVMRHGQAGSNVSKTWDFLGDEKNIITELGEKQICESAEILKDKSIDVIIASPILRTKRTAELAAECIGYKGEIVFDDRLKEFNPGKAWQGKLIHDYLGQFTHYPERYIKENPDGETYTDIRRRVMEALYDYEAKYQNKNILIVSHGSPILNMIVGSTGIASKDIKDDIENMSYPKNAEIRELDFVPFPHNEDYELDFHKPYIDQIELELDGQKLIRTPEVMDVWFDSGCMPYAQDHVLGESLQLSSVKTADYIAEGLDQTRGWFYTLHAVANILSDAPAQAYKNVICYGLLMDAEGKKMSKSIGNVIDPRTMFNRYGADTVRLWMYSVNQPGESKNFDEKTLAELHNKFFRTLENCVQILDMYGGEDKMQQEQQLLRADMWKDGVVEEWCQASLFATHKLITQSLDQFDMFTASRALRDFVTELSQWYIRRSREGLRKHFGARQFLRSVLAEFAKMSAPFTPFMSEWIWKAVSQSSKSVHEESWSAIHHEYLDKHAACLKFMEETRRNVSLALEARQKANIKVRQPLARLSLPQTELSTEYVDIIRDELNVKEIVIDASLAQGEVFLDTALTPELVAEGNARELIRSIQDMRKEADLIPEDRVQVFLIDHMPEWYEVHREMILQTVGASEIMWGSTEQKVEKV